MGIDRTRPAAEAAETQRGTAAGAGSRRAYRHPVRVAQRHPVGDAAERDGLLRYDLLATAAGLAGRRGLAAHLGGVPERTGAGGRDPVAAGHHRLVERARRFWGAATGPNPTDRAKAGSKRHLLTDGRGTPLAIVQTGANRHDSTQAIRLVDAIPLIRGPRGRPRRRPDALYGDRAYDADKAIRRPLRERGIEPMIARQGVAPGSGLGVHRWFVEATAAWLMHFRRLRVRYEKRDDIHEAFLILGCVLICWNKILRFC
jgi:transposase